MNLFHRFVEPDRLHVVLSILYKTKLPFILVFNKTDVQPHDFALDWMADFEEFQAALATHSGTRDAEGEPTYMNSLMNSMSLVLDEFYKNLKASSFFYYQIASPMDLFFFSDRWCVKYDRGRYQRIFRSGRCLEGGV